MIGFIISAIVVAGFIALSEGIKSLAVGKGYIKRRIVTIHKIIN